MNSIEIKIKSFSELSNLELSRIKKVGKKDGAFFEILESFTNETIKNPNEIFLSIGYDISSNPNLSSAPIVGWAMLDRAKEYNENSDSPTLMVFIRKKYRQKGLALKLIESLIEKMPETVCAYVTPGHKERKFFEKVSEKIEKKILIEMPLCYFAKYKEFSELS